VLGRRLLHVLVQLHHLGVHAVFVRAAALTRRPAGRAE
jgi:hypothetical protein